MRSAIVATAYCLLFTFGAPLIDASPLTSGAVSSRLSVHAQFEQGATQSQPPGQRRWATVPHYDSVATLFTSSYQQHDGVSVHLNDDHRFVWISRDVVSDELLQQSEASSHRQVMSTAVGPGEYVDVDDAFVGIDGIVVIQEYDGQSALLSVPSALLPTLDQRLGRFTRAYVLPTPAVAVADIPADNYTFPTPSLSSFISTLTRSQHWNTEHLLRTALTLTGEDQSALSAQERWTTRHSATNGCLRAGNWILRQAREALQGVPGAQCELEDYLEGHFAPNVVCVVPRRQGQESPLKWQHSTNSSSEAVLLSAHYDSRGTFGDPAAPGGDDDGSGTTMLLAITRILGDALRRADSHRHREIQLVWFSGEEEGLVGSHYYAQALRSAASAIASPHPIFNPPRSTSLRLAIQTDMIAYHAPGEPLQIAFPDKLSTKSATDYFWSIAQLYAPQLVRGYTPACCSDHQSFWEAGFPATWVFERNGPIADPKYHNSLDIIDRQGYDFEQLRSIGTVVLAGAAGLIWE